VYYIVFQGGSRFNRDTTEYFSVVPDLIGILHGVFRVVPDLIGILVVPGASGWFQI
jgi:hypothetical protein